LSYFYHVLVLVAVFGLLGYVMFNTSQSDMEKGMEMAKDLKDKLAGITVTSPAGDIAKINENKPAIRQQQIFVNDETGEELTEEQLVQIAVLKGIPEEDIILLAIEGGSSFGYTSRYKNTELSADHYQIGNPILFSGLLKKVIPGSCRMDRDTSQPVCEYIDPAKFKYTFTVTCQFREHCVLTDIVRQSEETHNDGTWDEKIQTSSSSFRTDGEYKMMLEANSEATNPETDKPYLITVEKIFFMVD